MPSHWSVMLQPLRAGVPVPSARALHAMSRSWLDVEDLAQNDIPSGQRRVLGYSVGRPEQTGAGVRIPLSLVDDALEAPLMTRALSGPLRYLQPDGHVRSDPGWYIGSVHQDARRSWDELMSQPASDHWQVTHVTPATRQVHKTRYTCEVGTETILRRSLSWLPGDDTGAALRLIASQVLVTDLRLSSRVDHPVVGNAQRPWTVSGCLGWRVWRFLDADAAELASFALRVAEFAGCGGLVSYGFGRLATQPVAERQATERRAGHPR